MNDKVKILHVLGHEPIGGVGTYLTNLIENIDREKFELTFIMFNSNVKSNFNKELEDKKCIYHKFDSFLKLTDLSKIYHEVGNYFKNNRFDIIHVHSPNLGPIIFHLSKKHYMSNFVLHSHASSYSDSIFKSTRNYFLNKVNKFYNTNNIACTVAAGNFIFGENNFQVHYNGIDLNKWKFDPVIRKRTRTELNTKDEVILLSVGNFFPVKNHDFLISIYSDILDTFPEEYLMILIGEGPTKEGIIKKIKEKGLEKKILILNRTEKLSDLMSASDLMILPSLKEGFGLVALESQLNSLQTLVSDNFPNELKLSNKIKFLSLENKKNWTRQIIKANKIDRESIKFEPDIRNFDIVETVKRIELFYAGIIEKEDKDDFI